MSELEFVRIGICQNWNFSELRKTLWSENCYSGSEGVPKGLNFSRTFSRCSDVARQILTNSNSDHFQFWPFPILTISNSDHFQFWPFPILTNSNSSKFQFWQIQILTNSNSDHFQFWQIQILTNSNSGNFQFWQFQILTISDSDNFQFLQKVAKKRILTNSVL